MDLKLQYNVGDELRIDGEFLYVDKVAEDRCVLTPKNENGHAFLRWDILDDKFVYERSKGVEPANIEH